MAFQRTFQCVESKARQVHILSRPAPIQSRKNVAQLLGMFGRHAFRCSPIVQRLKTAMFERPDHFVNL